MLNHPYIEQHEMRLEKTLESGTQEWFCPTCGRRMLMSYQSESERLDLNVLETGDETVSHTGSTGGLRIGVPEIHSAPKSTRQSGSTEGSKSGSSNVTYH
jgi:hypothetical protein